MKTRTFFSTLAILATLSVPMLVANQAQAGHRYDGHSAHKHHRNHHGEYRHHRKHRRHRDVCPTRYYKPRKHHHRHGSQIGYRYYDRHSGLSVLFNF